MLTENQPILTRTLIRAEQVQRAFRIMFKFAEKTEKREKQKGKVKVVYGKYNSVFYILNLR